MAKTEPKKPASKSAADDRPPFLKWEMLPKNEIVKLSLTGTIATHNSQFGQQLMLHVKSPSGRVYTWGIKIGSPTHVAVTSQLVRMIANAEPFLPVRRHSFENKKGENVTFIKVVEPGDEADETSPSKDDDIPF